MAQLWGVTCHMGSHSVTCYPTQVNTTCLNPFSKPGPAVRFSFSVLVADFLPNYDYVPSYLILAY